MRGQMKKQNSKDLLRTLEIFRDQEELRRILQKVKNMENEIASVEQKAINIKKILKATIDHLEPNKVTITSIRYGVEHIKNTWKDQTKGNLFEWTLNFEALRFHKVMDDISEVVKTRARNMIARTNAMAKVFSIVKQLGKLVKKIRDIENKLYTLISKKDISVENITKLKKLEDELNSLLKEAEKLGVDTSLVTFLQKASSEGGASGEDLNDNILRLLDENELKSLLSVRISMRNY